jgi:hypothetical protein
MKILCFLIVLIECSEAMTWDTPLGLAQKFEYGQILLQGKEGNHSHATGDYEYASFSSEKGIYEAQIDSIGIISISITINESNTTERVGLRFVCTVWHNDPKINSEYWNKQQDPFIMWLTNAKILTNGIADSDTIPTWGIPVSVENNKTTWLKVKKLFLTK